MSPSSHLDLEGFLHRRHLLRAGAVGCCGLSMGSVAGWRQTAQAGSPTKPSGPKSVIFLFLTGGLGQHDSFDMKPEGPVEFRGEFSPIATATPGIEICEHLPLIAQRSRLWSLVRSLTHPENAHEAGTYLMLTGKSKLSPTFKPKVTQPEDDPSIVSLAGAFTAQRGVAPTSAMLPEKISENKAFSGQFAGLLGPQHDPWLIECTDKPHQRHSYSGAFPDYLFRLHQGTPSDKTDWRFDFPNLSLPDGVYSDRFHQRRHLLEVIDRQRRGLEQQSAIAGYDRLTESAISLMNDPQIRAAMDVRRTDAKTLARYGNNSFGWSALMARRLVEAGVNIVQVNLGNFGSWDLHGNNFPCLKNYLFPPTDLAVSALLDDLEASGLLESTLVVMAGEFGRTPKIDNPEPGLYPFAGRDHWGPCQSVWFAGGGVQGGRVIGASDKAGAYPISDPQTPENLAATIYRALGIPEDSIWHDITGRPHPVYEAPPIQALFG
ncbi:MAG: DUF1501 domain-containing protein [Planctomycetaceae bacterium]